LLRSLFECVLYLKRVHVGSISKGSKYRIVGRFFSSIDEFLEPFRSIFIFKQNSGLNRRADSTGHAMSNGIALLELCEATPLNLEAGFFKQGARTAERRVLPLPLIFKAAYAQSLVLMRKVQILWMAS